MSLKLSVPGKTFFIGEYLALGGGPTLVACSSPRFKLKVKMQSSGKGVISGIHEASPAGLYYAKHRKDFSSFQLEFVDPYEGRGGFGASTAQFALLYAVKNWSGTMLIESERQIDIRELLQDYTEVAWNKKGTPPSGADLVAQVRGGVTYFEKRKSQLKSWGWPFANLDFLIVPTGFKVATHEHLQGLQGREFTSLEDSALMAVESFQNANGPLLIESIRLYREELQKLELTLPQTHETLLSFAKEQPKILAAKGCGALGADTLLVVFEAQDREDVIQYLVSKNLHAVAGSQEISDGLRMRLDSDFRKKGGIAIL